MPNQNPLTGPLKAKNPGDTSSRIQIDSVSTKGRAMIEEDNEQPLLEIPSPTDARKGGSFLSAKSAASVTVVNNGAS